MNVKNLKIGVRLGGAFSLVLLMLVAVAVVGVSRMSAINDSMTAITRANNVESEMAATMEATVADRMVAVRNIVLLDTPVAMQPEVERIATQARIYSDAETKLRATFAKFGLIDEEEKLLAALKEDGAAAQPLIDKVITLGLANQTPEAVKLLLGEMRTAQKKWIADLGALVASEKRQNEEADTAADVMYASARNMMVALSIVAVLLGLALAWLITRNITVPIQEALRVAQTVAAGDLTSKIEVTSNDETGMLLSALKAMNDSLKIIVGQVRDGTDTMTTASKEIAAGNLDLSSRTEEQASSLEETASSMEELTSTVKQNSDNARQAKSLAGSASDVAGKGGTVVAQVVATMSAINDSSRKVVEIISVIDGIAFQTNILALNAAVEAARAGEQGRGFAVVATEVRNLAQRSAAAAKEIKELIGNSVEKVGEGSRLVDEAGMTMQDVVESVRQVSDIIGEITAAGQEQVLGIEQINQAIIQMDGVTQQNAALVEQSAAAAEALQDQAQRLSQVVSMFVLDHAPSASSSLPAKKKLPSRSAISKTGVLTSTQKQQLSTARSVSQSDWETF